MGSSRGASTGFFPLPLPDDLLDLSQWQKILVKEPWPSVLLAAGLLLFIMAPNYFFRVSEADEQRMQEIRDQFQRSKFAKDLNLSDRYGQFAKRHPDTLLPSERDDSIAAARAGKRTGSAVGQRDYGVGGGAGVEVPSCAAAKDDENGAISTSRARVSSSAGGGSEEIPKDSAADAKPRARRVADLPQVD